MGARQTTVFGADPRRVGVFAYPVGGDPAVLDMNALVTAAEAATLLPGVSRHLVGMWVAGGKLTPADRRGRSPLYRWGDILRVEAATRNSPYSSRRGDRDRKPDRHRGLLVAVH